MWSCTNERTIDVYDDGIGIGIVNNVKSFRCTASALFRWLIPTVPLFCFTLFYANESEKIDEEKGDAEALVPPLPPSIPRP